MNKSIACTRLLLVFMMLAWQNTSWARYKERAAHPDTQKIMEEAYQGISGFERLKKREHKDIVEHGGFPTYGEITYQGFKSIFDDISAERGQKSKHKKKDQQEFVDMGSGVGKVVFQVYLDYAWVNRVVGIELSKTRFDSSQEVLERLEDKGLISKKRIIEFIHDSFLDVNIRGATIVYMCSTCFSSQLMRSIMEKLSQLKDGLIVLTLQEFPEDYKKYGFEFIKEYEVEMTWDKEKVYRYCLTRQDQEKALQKNRKPLSHTNTEEIINAIYTDISGFKRLGKREHKDLVEHGGYPTYGEITYQGAKILFDDLASTRMRTKTKRKKDVFYDLGTGVGRLPLQVYLEYPWIIRSVGIELSPTRFKGALEALARLKERGLVERKRHVEFIEDSILDVDVSDGTIFYAGSTCFSAKLMHGIMEKLSKLKKGIVLFTLAQLPNDYKKYGFEMVKEYKNVPMTWDTESVYRYDLVGEPQHSQMCTK